MATLTQLGYQVTSKFDRDTDLLFLERVKDLIIFVSNEFKHRSIDKYGVDDRYIQPYIAELILVNASMDSNITSKLEVLRTTNKIPAPIRYDSDNPFIFVGSVDRTVSFRKIKPYILSFSRNLRHIGNAICYFYTNEYIYIWNNTKLDRVLIEAVYESLDVTTDNSDPTGLCYKDDMEFPLAGDMLKAVIEEVTRIVRLSPDANPINPITTRDIQ